jgi:serine/threonine protein phosphatase PrpC
MLPIFSTYSLRPSIIKSSYSHISSINKMSRNWQTYLHKTPLDQSFNQIVRNKTSSTMNQPHWLKLADTINKHLLSSPEGYSYFNIPYFGKSYPFISPKLKQKIQQKECRLYANAEEIKKHLVESRDNAVKQQEEKRRIAPPLNQGTQNWFEKCLNYLFLGPSQPTLDTVIISPAEILRLNIKSEEFKEIGAAMASTEGRRQHMEDTHLAKKFDAILAGQRKTIILTAIFDGHAGNECAKFAAKNLEKTLKAYLESFNSKTVTDMGIANALSLSLIDVSHAYNPENLQGSLYNPDAGCTANIAIQIEGDLWIANSGDSRAIIVDGEGKCKQVTEDASLNEPRYANRVIEMGGNVIPVHGKLRVNGRLAVPVSLGDHWSNGVISARPNITKLEAKEFNNFDKCMLIQCCDGVFDVSTTEDVAARIKKSEGLALIERAKDIVASAYACNSTDNLSVLVRHLKY